MILTKHNLTQKHGSRQEETKKPAENRKNPSYSYSDCIKNLPSYFTEQDSFKNSCVPYNRIKKAKTILKKLTPFQERFLLFNVGAHLGLFRNNFSRAKIAHTLGFNVKTIDRALHKELFHYKSGKPTYNTNDYFVDGILFHKKLRKILKDLLRRHIYLTHGSFFSGCLTIIKKLMYRIMYALRSLLKTLTTEISASETQHFFHRKKEKVRVSALVYNKNTHQESVQEIPAPQPQSPISSHGSEIGIANTNVYTYTKEKNLKRDDRRLGEKAKAVIEAFQLFKKKRISNESI